MRLFCIKAEGGDGRKEGKRRSKRLIRKGRKGGVRRERKKAVFPGGCEVGQVQLGASPACLWGGLDAVQLRTRAAGNVSAEHRIWGRDFYIFRTLCSFQLRKIEHRDTELGCN